MALEIETFYIYKARDGWRWHLKARNGRIIAEGGEAYTRRQEAIDGLFRVGRVFWDATDPPSDAGILRLYLRDE